MTLWQFIKNSGKILFPSFCLHCGKECGEENWLCGKCKTLLVPFPHTVCPACHARTIHGRLENSCARKTGLTRFFSAYSLGQKPLQALLYTYKYRRASSLHAPIAILMYDWLLDKGLEKIFQDADTIFIPIPLHKERLHNRSFNQAELLAAYLAKKFEIPCISSALVRIKQTPSQLTAQSKEAREKNMQRAFFVADKPAVAGKRIILVDDVYTTGATMKHAALALREAGAAEVWGMTVARG